MIISRHAAGIRPLFRKIPARETENAVLRSHADDATGSLQSENIVTFHKRFAMRFAGQKRVAISDALTCHQELTTGIPEIGSH